MKKALADTVRSSREKQKMSQAELARKLECSPALVCRWEAGENLPTAKYMLRLIKVLGLNVKELV